MSNVINTEAFWTVKCDKDDCAATRTESKTDHRLGAYDAFQDAGWRIGVKMMHGIEPDLCPEHAR